MGDSLQQKVYQGILDDICCLSTSDYMDGICTKPFVFEDYVYATDGHIMVRFKKTNLSNFNDLPVSSVALKVIPLFSDRNIDIDKTYSIDIKDSIDMTMFDWIVEGTICPECNGYGHVEYKYTDRKNHNHTKYVNCPECDSECEIFLADSRRYKKYHRNPYCIISGMSFQSVYIGIITQIAEALGKNTFHLVHKTEPNKACVFTAGDVEILLMPKLLDTDPDLGDLVLFTLD
jgi:transposase-like protein